MGVAGPAITPFPADPLFPCAPAHKNNGGCRESIPPGPRYLFFEVGHLSRGLVPQLVGDVHHHLDALVHQVVQGLERLRHALGGAVLPGQVALLSPGSHFPPPSTGHATLPRGAGTCKPAKIRVLGASALPGGNSSGSESPLCKPAPKTKKTRARQDRPWLPRCR